MTLKLVDKNGAAVMGNDKQQSQVTLRLHVERTTEADKAEEAGAVPQQEQAAAAAEQEQAVAWEANERRRAVVTVVRAEHLPKKDMMGKCDPFVMVTWQGKTVQTQVKKSTYDCVWEETLEAFGWVDAGGCGSAGPVKVVVMDHDGLTGNDFVGESEVAAAAAVARPGADIEVSLPDQVVSIYWLSYPGLWGGGG
jgi:hypothetical protein